jgi:acetylornithine deacetylase/succinyl-diaminopimelate desuccinylase-like protein
MAGFGGLGRRLSPRRRSVAVASGLVAAMGVFVLGGAVALGGGGGAGMPNWWRPSAQVRAMIQQIKPNNLQSDVEALVSFGTRHTASSQTDPNRGIGAAGNWINDKLNAIAATSGGKMTVQRQTFIQPVASNIPTPTTITNIIATLQGTDATPAAPVYVVSAHYDSRVTDVLNFTSDAPGADDDASGVAAMLELARVFAQHPSKATIVFAAFDGEEQGLYGSAFSARQYAAAGTNIEGDLNMDTIGSPLGGNGVSEPHTVDLYSEGIPTNVTAAQISLMQSVGGENDGISRQLARYIKETGEKGTGMNVQLVFRRDRILRGSDQISFDQQGFPAVRFTEPTLNYNHNHRDTEVVNGVQNGDLIQFLDFNYLARVTRVVGTSLAALATSPPAPTNAQEHVSPPPGFSGSNDTVLTWNADPESDVVGYEIVWRDSTAPLWTHALRVGNVTSYTVTGLNKDNTQFGVRAIDSNGNRSPVAYPTVVTS